MSYRKNKRDVIFLGAEELFQRYGYKKVSVDDIVAKAGVAKGTFYLYFKTKDELYNQIIISYYEEGKKLAEEVIKKDVAGDIKLLFYKEIMYTLFYSKNNKVLKEIILKNPNYYSATVNFENIIGMDVELLRTIYVDEIKNLRQDIPLDVIVKVIDALLIALLGYEKDYSQSGFLEFAGQAVRILGDGLFFEKEWDNEKLQEINRDILRNIS